MKGPATILAVALLGGGSASPDPITFYGVGLVKVGTTVQDASKAAGTRLQTTPARGEELSCHFVASASKPTLLFMVEDGLITRVETDDPKFQTASGIRVGDSESRVRGVYGKRLEITEHQYIPSGHYLTVRSPDRRFALVVETDGRNVLLIRAGKVPSAEYVEGCL
jgi:hypothetical protein